jgi:hypothetical protein
LIALTKVAKRTQVVALTLVVALAGCGSPPEQVLPELPPKSPGTSELWGDTGERWSPAGRLPDFSHAGYAQGERPIPTVPVAVDVTDFGAVGDGEADDTHAFLEALAAVESGAVFVPAGRYRITKVLRLEKSGVVLRGAGRDQTVLFFPDPLFEIEGVGPQQSPHGPYGWSWSGGVIWAEAPDRERAEEGRVLARVTAGADRGGSSVEVADASSIHPGDMVRVVQYESNGSLSLHAHAGHPLNGRCLVDRPGFKVVDWALRVEGVDGNRIEFGRPLRLDVKPEWNAEIRTYEPALREVGVEDLTIEFAETEYNGHHKEPGYNGVLFKGVYNGWVRDVAIVNFDSGVHFWYSRYTTGDGILLTGRAGHYGLNLGGCQDCLMTRFSIENISVHDLSTSNLGNGSVFSRGRGPLINFDHHRGAAYENLFTDIHVGKAWIGGRRVWQCSGTKTDHYTAARETYWNIRPRLLDRNLPVWPELNVIGPMKITERVPPETTAAWVEPVKGLTPEDLHRAQLERRLGRALSEPLPLPAPRGEAEKLARSVQAGS